jgi:hypothetical protein
MLIWITNEIITSEILNEKWALIYICIYKYIQVFKILKLFIKNSK